MGYHFAFLPQTRILDPRLQKLIQKWTCSHPLPGPLWAAENQNMALSQKCKIETAPEIEKERGLQFFIFGSDPYFGPQAPKMGPKI